MRATCISSCFCRLTNCEVRLVNIFFISIIKEFGGILVFTLFVECVFIPFTLFAKLMPDSTLKLLALALLVTISSFLCLIFF